MQYAFYYKSMLHICNMHFKIKACYIHICLFHATPQPYSSLITANAVSLA